MALPGRVLVLDDLASLPVLSLESRLDLLRRRRRRTFLKRQLAVIGSVLVGMSVLLLAALGAIASSR
jgi:hypothetical protein